jgi:hypothetical protein
VRLDSELSKRRSSRLGKDPHPPFTRPHCGTSTRERCLSRIESAKSMTANHVVDPYACDTAIDIALRRSVYGTGRRASVTCCWRGGRCRLVWRDMSSLSRSGRQRSVSNMMARAQPPCMPSIRRSLVMGSPCAGEVIKVSRYTWSDGDKHGLCGGLSVASWVGWPWLPCRRPRWLATHRLFEPFMSLCTTLNPTGRATRTGCFGASVSISGAKSPNTRAGPIL